jgi:hypothetical protein
MHQWWPFSSVFVDLDEYHVADRCMPVMTTTDTSDCNGVINLFSEMVSSIYPLQRDEGKASLRQTSYIDVVNRRE